MIIIWPYICSRTLVLVSELEVRSHRPLNYKQRILNLHTLTANLELVTGLKIRHGVMRIYVVSGIYTVWAGWKRASCL